MQIFSERLKQERKEKGLSQRQLAEILKIPQSTYKGYELVGQLNGREPSLEMLVSLAKFFEVRTDYLLGLED